MCSCIHELLNVFEDSAEREHTVVLTCSSGIGQFQVSRLCSCPHVQVYTFRQVPQRPIIYYYISME